MPFISRNEGLKFVSMMWWTISACPYRPILLPMYDGEVHFYNDHGTQLDKKLYVPRLRVRKGWYVVGRCSLSQVDPRLTPG